MYRVILEGITGSGKTTLYHKLLRRVIDEGYYNIFPASQFYTSSLVWQDTSDQVENRIYEIMNNILNIMEKLDEQYDGYHTQDPYRRYQSVLESFHLENIIKSFVRDERLFYEIDNRLYNLGYKLVLLEVPDEEIEERSIISTKRYRNSCKWDNYLSGLGRNNDEIVDYFRLMQNFLREYSKQTKMQVLRISTFDIDWDKYIEEIVDFCKKQ